MADNKAISFTVPGKPVGKQRPKFSRTFTGVRTYTPRKTQEYEDLVRISYRAASKQKLEGLSVQPYTATLSLRSR